MNTIYILDQMNEIPNFDKTISIDPYAQSVIVAKLEKRIHLRQPLKIACFDIDSTMTGDPKIVSKVRNVLDRLGFVTIYNTSRTEEMVMSEHAFLQSVQHGFSRPRPHLGEKNGKKYYIPPEIAEPQGLLDPDIIAGSTGTQIYLLQKDGSYLPDHKYHATMGQSSTVWRSNTQCVLDWMKKQKISYSISVVDKKHNYQMYTTDVASPEYRFQINFSSEAEKLAFTDKLMTVQLGNIPDAISAQVGNIRIIEDSKPEGGDYRIYLTPYAGSKQHAVEHIIEKLCLYDGISREQLEILFAGDSYPDLIMGLDGGLGVEKVTLLLVGGSRLCRPLADGHNDFAGKKIHAIQKRKKEKTQGRYAIEMPDLMGNRELLDGNQLFPNTHAAETILAYLHHEQA